MSRHYVNKVTLRGNLGCHPETRFTPSGTQVTTASLATNDSWATENGESQHRTEWHRLVFWRRLAEIASQYLYRGNRLAVAGRLHSRTWMDARGHSHRQTEIIVTDMKLLDAPDGPGQLDMACGSDRERGEAEQLTFSSAMMSADLDGLPF